MLLNPAIFYVQGMPVFTVFTWTWKLCFQGLEMQKTNIPTDKAQKPFLKNGGICLFIIFAPGVMIIITSKMAHSFGAFCWWQEKLSKIFLFIWKTSFSSFRKCYGLLGSELPFSKTSTLENARFWYFFDDLTVFLIFLPSISHKQLLLTIPFSERTQ